MLFLSFTPSSYVVRRPGPAFNLLSRSSLKDAQQFITFKAKPNSALPAVVFDRNNRSRGKLNVMTVGVYGTPKQKPYWPELLLSWLTPHRMLSPWTPFSLQAQHQSR